MKQVCVSWSLWETENYREIALVNDWHFVFWQYCDGFHFWCSGILCPGEIRENVSFGAVCLFGLVFNVLVFLDKF